MIIVPVEQGTEEWFRERLGKPTASSFDKIVTLDGGPSKQAQKYMFQLAGERLTGTREDGYINAAMQRGIELESEARQLYEMLKDTKVEKVGICYYDEEKAYSCSPDGLVGEDGLLEIKCPLMATQVGYLLNNELPADYFQQVQGQLYITGRKWCDFLSYYPGMKPLLIRVKRDENFIASLRVELSFFVERLEKITKQLRWGDL